MHGLLSILHSLVQIDQWLFKKINSQWTNSFFDFLLPFFREAYFWMPLYLFLFLFVAINFKRNWWWWVVLFLCTVALTDMTGTRIFKYGFQRLRPCNDPDFMSYVRLVIRDCGTGYSFISNHAANHFGMAAFFFFTMRHHFKRWVWIGFIWAAAIAYSQVYVGIHYPSDVLAGALLGVFFGLFMAMFFNKKFGFANFDNQPTFTP
jgi:membrane-associated phospholipid phosphatase